MRLNESKLQAQCVKAFRFKYPKYHHLFFAVPNGGSRNPIEGARLKAEGVVAGVADMLLLVPNHQYHGLCIEFKYGKGRQQDSQKKFQTEVERVGFKYIIVRSLEGFCKEIDEFFAN